MCVCKYTWYNTSVCECVFCLIFSLVRYVSLPHRRPIGRRRVSGGIHYEWHAVLPTSVVSQGANVNIRPPVTRLRNSCGLALPCSAVWCFLNVLPATIVIVGHHRGLRSDCTLRSFVPWLRTVFNISKVTRLPPVIGQVPRESHGLGGYPEQARSQNISIRWGGGGPTISGPCINLQ